MSRTDALSDASALGLTMNADDVAEDAERWLFAVGVANARNSANSDQFDFRLELSRQAKSALSAQAELDVAFDRIPISADDIDYEFSLYPTNADLIEALLDDLHDSPDSALKLSDDALKLDASEADSLRRVRMLLVRSLLSAPFAERMMAGSSLQFHEIILAHAIFERHRRAHPDCDIRASASCPACMQFTRTFRSCMARQHYSEDLHNAIMVLAVTDSICSFLKRRKIRRDSENSLLAFGAITRPAMWNVYFTILAMAPYEHACHALSDIVALLDNCHNCDVIMLGVKDWWTAPMALHRVRLGDVSPYIHSILAAILVHAFVSMPAYRNLLEAVLEVASIQMGDQFARQSLVSLLRKLGRKHFPQQSYTAKPWGNLLKFLGLVQEKVICDPCTGEPKLRLQPDGSQKAVDKELTTATLKLLKSISCDEEPTPSITDPHERRVLMHTSAVASLLDDVRLLTTIIPVKLRDSDNRLPIARIVKQFTSRIFSPKSRLSALTKAAVLPFNGSAAEVVEPFLSAQAPGRLLTLATLRQAVQTTDHVRMFRRYLDCWSASSLCATLTQFGMSQRKAIRVCLLLQATHLISPVSKRNAMFMGGSDLFVFEAC